MRIAPPVLRNITPNPCHYASLPSNWAVFLLVPVDLGTVLEMLAGPAAATYVFRKEIDAVNRDLQLLHP